MNGKYYFYDGRLLGGPAFFALLAQAGINRFRDFLVTKTVGEALGSFGRGSRIGYGLHYRYPGNILIGNYVSIARHVRLTTEIETGWLRIADKVWINNGCTIDMSGGVSIGAETTLSERVCIYTHTHGLSPRSKPNLVPLEIGSKVWLGVNSTILASVQSIGDNSVVGAGSVVTKNVEANTVVAGNPARLIRTL